MENHKKNAVLVIALSYFSAFISFAGTLLIARELGADQFGVMTLALALGAFLAPTINLGADKVFVAAYMRLDSNTDKRRLARNNFVSRLLTLVLVVMLTMIGTVLYTEPDQYLGHITLITWAALLGFYPMVWFDAIGKTSSQNVLNLWERGAICVFALSLMIMPESWTTAGLVGVVLLLIRCLSIVQQYMVWNQMTGLHGFLRQSKRRSALRERGVSFSVTSAALLSITVAYFSQLILSREVSAPEFAAYGLAFLFVNMVILFQSQLVRILLRTIARDWGDLATIKQRVIRNCSLSLAASVLLAVVAWLGMRLLPWILSDDRYEVIAQYDVYLCGWTLVMGVGQIVTQYAINGGQQQRYFLVNLIGAIATMLLGFWLIPVGGAKAAALILLVVQLLMNIAMGFVLHTAIHARHLAAVSQQNVAA